MCLNLRGLGAASAREDADVKKSTGFGNPGGRIDGRDVRAYKR